MPAKITKTDMIDAIAFYFTKKGQRLSNLQKATIKKLEEIIKKYDIDLAASLVELKEFRENDKIRQQERKAEQDAEYERLNEERNRINKLILQKKLMMWEELSDEDREKVRQFQYDKYVEDTTKRNLDAKITTDIMEEKCRREGLPSFSLIRENDNTLIVKGVHIINGWISPIKSREDYQKNKHDDDYWTANCRCSEKLILELYEAAMIKKGFWKDDDGEFYITMRVKKQNK